MPRTNGQLTQREWDAKRRQVKEEAKAALDAAKAEAAADPASTAQAPAPQAQVTPDNEELKPYAELTDEELLVEFSDRQLEGTVSNREELIAALEADDAAAEAAAGEQ